MMIQDLFNTRPKTLMDYEPSGAVSKKVRTSQTTTQAQTQNPFSSNVKIVGDDITEKDYDTFFEGFNSANDNPLWQKRKLQQEPKIQRLPYRPQENGEAKISLYSGASPAYTQAKNTSQNAQETWWDKIKDTGETLLPYISPAMALGKVLENEIKKIHYGRNQYNVDLPKNADEAKAWNWETEIANCHQFTTQNGERYIKYVSPDGKREVIFDSTGKVVVSADEDMGTYNYANPDFLLEHGIVDVLPWILYGNTPEDPTKWYQRLGGLFKFEK